MNKLKVDVNCNDSHLKPAGLAFETISGSH